MTGLQYAYSQVSWSHHQALVCKCCGASKFFTNDFLIRCYRCGSVEQIWMPDLLEDPMEISGVDIEALL